MFKELLHTAMDRIQQPEVQMTGTAGASAAYAFTLNQWVGILTVVLLLAQLGLAGHKYWLLWKNRKKRGTKE
jgi:hypothetical protein